MRKKQLGLHEVDPAATNMLSHPPHLIIIDAGGPRSRRRPRPLWQTRRRNQRDRGSLIIMALSILLTVGVFIISPVLNLVSQAKVAPTGNQHTAAAASSPAGQPVTIHLQASRKNSTGVQATGHTHVNATYASGRLVFYNESSQSQTIGQGLTLTGSNGLQIRLMETLVVPASNLPQPGIASGKAQALTAGQAGNVPANWINGLCPCGDRLSVKNLVFSGGQDAQDYLYLRQQDIDQAAGLLQTQLGLEALTLLQEQVTQSRPVTVSPSTCNAQVNSSRQVGSRTTRTTVTVQVECDQTITINQRA